MVFDQLGEGYPDLPRPLEQLIGALTTIAAVVFIAFKFAAAVARPIGLLVDEDGITLRTFALGRLTVVPWREVSGVFLRTKRISRTKVTYLVVKRGSRSHPLRRRNPLTDPRIPDVDPERDAVVPIDQWWRLDRERFAEAVESHTGNRVRLELELE
ncbi:hypothetical protein [Glycomyces halotolerans]